MAKLDKIKSVVGAMAPAIASALGGPLAGLAVGSLSKALLGDPAAGQADPSKIEAAVIGATDPATFAKIRQADQEFQLALQEHGIDLEKIAEADRASARQREAAVKDRTPAALAFLGVGAFVGFVFILVFGVRTTLDAALVGAVLGYLAANSQQVFTYYFGSSAGSDRKTEILAGTAGARSSEFGVRANS